MITTQSDFHIAVQFAHEFRTQQLIHIEVPKNIAGNPGDGRVVANNFSFPLRVYKVPPRVDFVRFCLLAVTGDVKPSMSLKDEGVTSFRIDKTMLAFEPFRLVSHLRQNKSRRHRSQSLCRIQNRNMGSLSANIDIGLIFSRPPLGHESRGKRGAAWAVYRVEPDLGISFLKVADGQPGIINDVDDNLTFRLSRLERFLPFDLPGWPGLSSSTGFCRHEEKQADNQSEKKQA